MSERDIKPFWKRIFSVTVFMFSISIILLILINSVVLFSELQEEAETNLDSSVDMSDKIMYSYLNQFDYNINSMSIINELVEMNEKRDRYISFQKYRLELEKALKDFYFSFSGMTGIIYRDNNSNLLHIGRIESNVDANDIFNQIVNEYEDKHQSTWRSVSVDDKKYLAYYKNISYLDESFNMHNGGKMIILLDEEMVYRDTFRSNDDTGEKIFAIDGYGRICCGDIRNEVGMRFDDVFTSKGNVFIKNDNNELYYVRHRASVIDGWKTVGVMRVVDIYYPIFTVILNSLLVFVIILMVAIFIFYKISSYVNVPLIRLAHQLAKVENGIYDTIEQVEDKTEIGYLYYEFNQMVSKLDEQFNENYLLNIKMKEAYIKTLEQQINPHFIFNTLQLIQMMCIAGKTKEAFDVCGYFGEVVRFNLQEEDEVNIEDELENLRNYFKILELRFYRQFEYSITIPDDIKKFYVLKFLFQPIVENAIQHAFIHHKEKCRIDILVRKINGEIVVIVKDNGDGMTKEKVQEITKYMNDQSNISSNKSIGLKNSNQRIKLLYGERFGIKIYSKENKGTSILICIPACKEKKYPNKEA